MLNKRITDLAAYLGWPGLIIAFLLGDRCSSRFHLNQALMIYLALFAVGIAAHIPLIGWLIGGLCGLFCAACWFIGFINAIQGVEQPVPLIGQFHIL